MTNARIALALSAVLLAAPAAAQETHKLEMKPGEVRLLRFDGIATELLTGDPEVVDALPLTDRQIAVIAKKVGSASVLAMTSEKHLIGSVSVSVVPELHVGRRAMNVTSFTSQGRFIRDTYRCDNDILSKCYHEKTEQNLVAPPIISTGPIITNGGLQQPIIHRQ